MTTGFTTIGHSTRSFDELAGMLRDAGVGLVADVRSFPRSRHNPAFNIDHFPDDLARWQIGYRHFPALGGRKPLQPGIDPAINALWRVASFHNYADYALGDVFGAAFAELIRLGQRQRLAIMCAEAVWWRCHRRIITDYLLAAGHPVLHLLAPGQSEPAQMTKGAQIRPDGTLTYPAAQGRLDFGTAP
ncbi:MAG: DUF488 domain-containing protein [Paracoccus sp. (in: a-proteobacteria)]|uniref:DUF488 domain-containing protein n=1 Tax=Paracoccus sp. TaxID=267 RepID=UPI0026DEBF7A|nr:DUF488 domain-containing protein [Paracoccus sp. (in: a-proteobacteria)]MDO5633136.1 DUF488 domain-containing protein [Paracoccus sp. (in: a-proteobacteria)]